MFICGWCYVEVSKIECWIQLVEVQSREATAAYYLAQILNSVGNIVWQEVSREIAARLNSAPPSSGTPPGSSISYQLVPRLLLC